MTTRGPQRSDQVRLPTPVAERIRTAVSRTGTGFLVTGVLLAGLTLVLVLTTPRENGFHGAITIAGGTIGGILVVLAGIGLLDAKQVISGQFFLVGRARRVQRLLLLLFALSVVVAAMCTYGLVSIGEGSIIAALLPSLAGCLLTGLAMVVARSVLRPTADRD